jgi:hypothetical protein
MEFKYINAEGGVNPLRRPLYTTYDNCALCREATGVSRIWVPGS